MKLLLLEKRIKIPHDFQKLLDNARRIYGSSKNEKIVLITQDKILFQEVNFNQKTEEYFIDYHCYVFFDVKKSIYRDTDLLNESYFEMSEYQNSYRSWSVPCPFLNNLRTDYDKYNNLSLLFISLSYSEKYTSDNFLKFNKNEIYYKMESQILSYSNKLVIDFNNTIKSKYVS